MSTSTPSLEDRVAALEAEIAALPAAQDTLTPNLLLYNAATKTWSPPAWLAQLASLNPTDLETAQTILGIPAGGAAAAQIFGVPAFVGGAGLLPANWFFANMPDFTDSGTGLVYASPQGPGFQVKKAGWYGLHYVQTFHITGGSGGELITLSFALNGALDTFSVVGNENSNPPGATYGWCVANVARGLAAGTTVQPVALNTVATAPITFDVGFVGISRVV
jgi:hypothetical protein